MSAALPVAKGAPIEQLHVRVGDFVFDGHVAGPADGRPVILLHGFPQSAWSWRHQVGALGAAGYRALAFDQRGYSSAARPSEVESYKVGCLVGDVLGVADAMGWDTFDLAGHDWGAAVAWQVAGRHPDRLRTLTILSVPHPFAFGKALASGESDQSDRSSYIQMFRQVGVAEDLFLADAGDGRGPGAGLRDLYERTGLSEEGAKPYVDLLVQPGALTAALNWYRAASAVDMAGLGPIAMPTMYVWSTNDPALGREGAEATREFVAGPYRFEVLEGISHWIAEEAPDVLNALMVHHLGTH